MVLALDTREDVRHTHKQTGEPYLVLALRERVLALGTPSERQAPWPQLSRGREARVPRRAWIRIGAIPIAACFGASVPTAHATIHLRRVVGQTPTPATLPLVIATA